MWLSDERNTTMAMYGANPEQLAALGSKLKAQREPIQSVTDTVTGALSGTEWTGPARDAFQAQWDTSFKSTLAKLIEAFDAAGLDCINRSNDLMTVMGAR
ncbi:MAG: WXG100 family type VII secretion target [Ilumatobacteraceae bacterium]